MLFLKPFQQRQDLRLNGSVQRRRRFIQNNQLRLQDQRAGNGDTLALPAGEFSRIAVARPGIQAHFGHHPHNFLLALLSAQAGLMHAQTFLDNL